jgi:predicted  nucleic acid-binding Zn-ribbon protein
MGVRTAVIVILFLLLLHSASAEISYKLDTDLSNSKTVNHGDSHTIRYYFTNENMMCSIECTARIRSNFYNTPSTEFTITTSTPVPKTFTLRAPTKSESNYEPEDSVEYSIDVDCTTVESAFPICFEGEEEVYPENSDSRTFTLNYELSTSEKSAKVDYESLVSTMKNSIQDFYNQGQELDSFYENLKNKVLIPSSTKQEISELVNQGERILSAFDTSQEQYGKLEVQSALSTLKTYQSTNFNSLGNDIDGLHSELQELKDRHDDAVADLMSVKALFQDADEEFQRAGLTNKYLTLVSNYEKIKEDLENLQFSSYNSIEQQIKSLKSSYDELQKEKEQRENEIFSQISNVYFLETSKIGSPSELTRKSILGVTITLFCDDFEETIPQQFREYNEIEQKKVDRQNEENQQRNEFLDSIKGDWEALSNKIEAIVNLAEGKVFDKSLENGCEISPLLEDNFQANDLETAKEKCTSFENTLRTSIAENSKATSKFFNFFKYLFSDKPVINQEKLPSLESFKKPTDLTYDPLSFDEETNILISDHCSFNPRNIKLTTPKELGTIGYDKSNTEVKSKTILGNCEELNCYNNRDTFPVLFVHGHMFTDSKDPMVDSRYTFDNMISYMASHTNNAFDAGTIVDRGNEFLDSGLKTNPGVALFRTTYYGYAYIDSSGKFQFEKRNYESITEYANKLNNIIDAILETTGRKKVKIVSHSMGGLVVREYLRRYGSSKVDTFIMIGTPNQGIVDDVQSACDDFGADTECAQMAKGSSFLQTLSQGDDLPSRTYVLSGTYNNKETDGIVLKENSVLNGVSQTNFVSSKTYIYVVVNYLLSNDLVHGDLVQPSMMPQTTGKAIDLLEIS